MLFFKKLPLALVAAVATSTFQSTNADTFCGYLNTTDEGNFTTLFTVLNSTDLCGALEAGGPYTLFAPTDEAFDKVPPAILDCLVNNTGALSGVLKYHVIEGVALLASTLAAVGIPGAFIKTFQGEPISVNYVNSTAKLMIINSTVVAPFNVEVDNGTISAQLQRYLFSKFI